MKEKKNRVVEISGLCIHPDFEGDFIGEILFELGEGFIYYTWTIKRIDGEFLGQVSLPVSLRVIPENANKFEFALDHALTGINKYRMTRKKSFLVKNWKWRK
jgi:hypothetical protein